MAASAPTEARRKPWIVEFYGSAIGKKYAMAISGIVGLGYVFAHMVGNLKIYLGAESINHYAEWLRQDLLVPLLPENVTLWLLRLVLIGALVVHLHAAFSLTVMNRRARDTAYEGPRDWVAADFAARTMRWTGVIVLLFIGFHLADITWGTPGVSPEVWEHGEVYANVVASFSRPVVAGIYIVANIALGVHLFHGVWSLFQSLGINHQRFNQFRRSIALGFTVLVVGGNLTFPIAVLTGIVS